MLNIHPSLLPEYRGLHTHRRVLEAGEPGMAPACTSSPRNSMAVRWSCSRGSLCCRGTPRAPCQRAFRRGAHHLSAGPGLVRAGSPDVARRCCVAGWPAPRYAPRGGLQCTHQLTDHDAAAPARCRWQHCWACARSARCGRGRAQALRRLLRVVLAWHDGRGLQRKARIKSPVMGGPTRPTSEPRGLGKMFSERPHMVSKLKGDARRSPAAELQGHRRHFVRQAHHRPANTTGRAAS